MRADLAKTDERVGLLDVERAKAYLEHCRDLDDVKKVRDKAVAVARYMRTRKAADDSAVHAAEIARRAERRLGEMSAELDKGHGPGRGKTSDNEADVSKEKYLKNAGIEPRQARRWEAIASVPEDEFDEALGAAAKQHRPASANELIGIAKHNRKTVLAEELNAKPLPETTGRFNVIVIDPPWQYEKRAADTTHRGRNPYPDMAISAIKALPVGDRAEDDCVLWLWTTNAFMREAYECLDAWGFTAKTILTWVKDRMGTGDWLRGKTEHCLMAVRGKPVVQLTNQTTALEAPLREHSRKPDEFFALVESLCPGTRLEMFAREGRDGWQAWGAEKEKFK